MSRVRSHLLETYGRLPSVWIGIVCTSVSQLLLKIGIPLVAATWLTNLVFGRPFPSDYLVLMALVYGVALIFEYGGGYIFVRGTDAAYEGLVGRFYDLAMSKEVRFFETPKLARLHRFLEIILTAPSIFFDFYVPRSFLQ